MINSITLTGNIGRDPIIKQFDNGDRFAFTSLAQNVRGPIKEDGSRETTTHWYRLKFYGPGDGGLIDIVENLVKKGIQVAVHGKLKSETSITEDGKKHVQHYIEIRGPGSIQLFFQKSGTPGNHSPKNDSANNIEEPSADTNNKPNNEIDEKSTEEKKETHHDPFADEMEDFDALFT